MWTDLQAGRHLRDARAAARAGVHRRRGADAGARHRRQHGDLQRHQHGAAPAAAVRRRRPPGVRVEHPRRRRRPTISVPAGCSTSEAAGHELQRLRRHQPHLLHADRRRRPRAHPGLQRLVVLLRRARRAAAARRAVPHRRRGSVGGRAVARAVEAPVRRGSVDRRPHDHAERTAARWCSRSCGPTSSGRRSPRGRARRRAPSCGFRAAAATSRAPPSTRIAT